MATTLTFKNLELETLTIRGEFRNWRLFFSEVSGKEPVEFAVDFVIKCNKDVTGTRPVALDTNSANSIRMFFKNVPHAEKVLAGFFKKQGVLRDVNWSEWALTETVELF